MAGSNPPSWYPLEGLLSTKYRRIITAAFLLVTALTLLTFYSPSHTVIKTTTHTATHKIGPTPGEIGWEWNYQRDGNNLLMTDAQCSAAFPGFFEEIERAVEHRKGNPVTLEEIEGQGMQYGYGRAMIYDQKLYVLHIDSTVFSRTSATLHAIHRAILSSPEPLPNIEFTFTVNDAPASTTPPTTIWALTRRSSDPHPWLIPDFGLYSWPEPLVGTYSEVVQKIIDSESTTPWSAKTPKLVWRGAPMDSHEMRQALVDASEDKSWADVHYLDWKDKEKLKSSLLSMPQHCAYKFAAHTEGASYSGRFKYLLACDSVVVAHELEWVQHHHPLLISSGPKQNFVQVDRKFASLEREMNKLLDDDGLAMGIAHEAKRVFRERYLTGAAGVCYWRRLIRGWREVSFEPAFYKDGGKEWRGVPVESWFLMGKTEWEPY